MELFIYRLEDKNVPTFPKGICPKVHSCIYIYIYIYEKHICVCIYMCVWGGVPFSSTAIRE